MLLAVSTIVDTDALNCCSEKQLRTTRSLTPPSTDFLP